MTTDTTDRDDRDVIVRRADQVELFVNTSGDLVFQRAHTVESSEEYVHIVIPRDHVRAVSKRMVELVKETKEEFGR